MALPDSRDAPWNAVDSQSVVVARRVVAHRPEGVMRQLAAILTAEDRRPALANLDVPTLVIHGNADPLVPVEAGWVCPPRWWCATRPLPSRMRSTWRSTSSGTIYRNR